MKTLRNPFTTLYVTERLDQAKFPELFSPFLVPYIAQLFEAGNVVVEGTQGTGKSMLLALLSTEVRIAFEASNENYPIEPELCRFISAGINLATNEALRSVARWSKNNADSTTEIRQCFVDYVNCWILRDFLDAVDQLTKNTSTLWDKYELGGTRETFIESLPSLSTLPYLKSCANENPSFGEIKDYLSSRIRLYLKFFNGRPKSLPAEFLDSQSQTLGQPISDAVAILKQEGVLNRHTQVLISIDQFEQLLEMEASLPTKPYGALRDVIDQAMHRREPTLNFRVGTRPYAWQETPGEALRDYDKLNLDEMLRRTEHGNRKVFETFATDVFRRRLKSYGYGALAGEKDPIESVLGKYPRPKERVQQIAANANWGKHLSFPEGVSEPVKARLREIAVDSPLDAKLGTAWAGQNGTTAEDLAGLSIDDFPWNQTDKKPWWRKERIWVAILQLAADNRQRIVMNGKKDVIDLSGANILVFSSICQHIWDCWIRSMASSGATEVEPNMPIPWKVQTDGIQRASNTWHEKIGEEKWIGDSLIAFIDEAGHWLRKMMTSDKRMSYPGGNGISLSNRDMIRSPDVRRWLSEAAGRGYLLQRKHKSKDSSRGESIKWYPHPILTPYYELTFHQTKEPRYIKIEQVEEWLSRARIAIQRVDDDSSQLRLPGFQDGKQ